LEGNEKTDIDLYGTDNPHLRWLATIRTYDSHKWQRSYHYYTASGETHVAGIP